MPVPSEPGAAAGRRRPSFWAWPLALAVALAAYHVWDLAFRGRGTGLRVALVTVEQAKAAIAGDPRAIAIDVRLHGETHPLPRAIRVPYMQLGSRMRELDRYRRARVFIVAATEDQGISAAAMLARLKFSRVALVRDSPSARARAKTSPPVPRALTSKDGLISLKENTDSP